MQAMKESQERRGGTLITTFIVGIVGLVRGKSWSDPGRRQLVFSKVFLKDSNSCVGFVLFQPILFGTLALKTWH